MLQPDKLKKLNENAIKMANEGRSQEEILEMKDAFIAQFGSEKPLKKKSFFGIKHTSATKNKYYGITCGRWFIGYATY